MQVLRGFRAPAGPPCVLTIGNFDGLHRGHQALLRWLTDKAKAEGLPASVLTFEPHPRERFTPEEAPARLTSLREKLLLFAGCEVDRIHIQRFDKHFARLDASAFIDTVLVRGLRASHLLIGDDFRFGERRTGDFAMLQAAGKAHGFKVEAMPTLAVADERASSSAVRKALERGDLDHAARLLGRPYSIAGRVVHGNKLGRQLGFPTANIPLQHRRPVLSGVFAIALAGLGKQNETRIAGVANLGLRPTIGGNTQQLRLEAHLLDWHDDCYGACVQVYFLHKLRDEIRFPSLDDLKAQIARDIQTARDWFSLHPNSLHS